MMDLNTLLTQAVAQQAAGAAAKSGREKMKDSRLSTRERDEIAEKVRQWESEADYVAVGLVWRCERITCDYCANVSMGRGQVLLEQKHTRMAGTKRYVEARAPWPEGLPRKTQFVESCVYVCAACAAEQDFK